MNRYLLAFGVFATIWGASSLRSAWACGAGLPAGNSAFPAAGAVDVSPQTSIILVTGAAEVPPGLTLLANGVGVALPGIQSLGWGQAGGSWAYFWRFDGALEPATSYVVQVGGQELTSFSTAATYDKTPGTSPKLGPLRLWRVRFPTSEIAAGGCVFAEFEGYFALDVTPGALPGTPPDEIVSVLSLAPQNGGATQQFVFSGTSELPGGFLAGPGGRVALPSGGSLSPSAALWKPQLEADRTYCATISIFGRNDRAAGITQSDPVCATVTSLAASGASADGASGCSVSRGGAPLSSPTIAFLLSVAVAVTARSRRR